jgi:hypothetical protein
MQLYRRRKKTMATSKEFHYFNNESLRMAQSKPRDKLESFKPEGNGLRQFLFAKEYHLNLSLVHLSQSCRQFGFWRLSAEILAIRNSDTTWKI